MTRYGPLALAAVVAVGCEGLLPWGEPEPEVEPPAAPGAEVAAVEPQAGEPEYLDDPAELADDPAVAARAKVIWDTRCARCHGREGHGAGKAGKGLATKPRDFHDAKWQADTPDEHIRRVIIEGGAAAGLDPAMANNEDLRGQPKLVDELVEVLRGLPHWKPRAKAPKPQ